MKYAFGIDLGTTNSCIAVKVAGKPAEVITLADGRSTLPSCVMYRDGKITVGYEAYKHRYDVNHVVYSSKRDIGSDKIYTVYANGDDKPPIQVTPIDVAAEILKKLKADAELIYGKDFITEATITVPAYFTPERRAATIQAAEKAGIKVVALINEPTAAAVAYTEGKFEPGQILVYDLGGGTFDVTLLQMLQSNSQLDSMFGDAVDSADTMATVITSSGNPRLGGDDIDELTLIEAVAFSRPLFYQQHPELPKDINFLESILPESKEKLILLIEQNKKRTDLNSLTAPMYINYNGQEICLQITITTEAYVAAFNKVFEQSMALVKQCLVGRDTTSLSKIILIGGSTKLQILRDRMQEAFAQEIYVALNPDEAVALGAAVHTAIQYGEVNMTVTDVLPQSIGIECYSELGSIRSAGRFKKLIAKDTPIPTSVTTMVRTIKPMQDTADVPIYQGEDTIAANNSYIGYIHLDLTPTEDIQEIRVTVVVTASGVLQAKLSAGSTETSVELQNILRPSETNKTAADKLVTRYERILGEYKDMPGIFSRGEELLRAWKAQEVPFADVRKFFTDITRERREAAQEEAQKTAQFSRAVNDTRSISSTEDTDEDEE